MNTQVTWTGSSMTSSSALPSSASSSDSVSSSRSTLALLPLPLLCVSCALLGARERPRTCQHARVRAHGQAHASTRTLGHPPRSRTPRMPRELELPLQLEEQEAPPLPSPHAPCAAGFRVQLILLLVQHALAPARRPAAHVRRDRDPLRPVPSAALTC